jgi:hypothetical protein
VGAVWAGLHAGLASVGQYRSAPAEVALQVLERIDARIHGSQLALACTRDITTSGRG